MVDKNFNITAKLDQFFFEKLCQKCLKCVLFSKITLVTARKKDFQVAFSAFESQDKIQIEYI